MSTHGVASSKSRQKENGEGLGGKKDTTKGPQRGAIGNGQYTIATGGKKNGPRAFSRMKSLKICFLLSFIQL